MTKISGPTIRTASGDYFSFEDFDGSSIRMGDIAHALSNVCRFGGHCREFYSVAQHSILVSMIVPQEHALQALLHDGTEAYLGDMVKPLKEMMPQFKAIEDELERAIFRRFGLPEEMHPSIKTADIVLLATEQRDIMNNNDLWTWTGKVEPLDEVIVPMAAGVAKAYFMNRYKQILAEL